MTTGLTTAGEPISDTEKILKELESYEKNYIKEKNNKGFSKDDKIDSLKNNMLRKEINKKEKTAQDSLAKLKEKFTNKKHVLTPDPLTTADPDMEDRPNYRDQDQIYVEIKKGLRKQIKTNLLKFVTKSQHQYNVKQAFNNWKEVTFNTTLNKNFAKERD